MKKADGRNISTICCNFFSAKYYYIIFYHDNLEQTNTRSIVKALFLSILQQQHTVLLHQLHNKRFFPKFIILQTSETCKRVTIIVGTQKLRNDVQASVL